MVYVIIPVKNRIEYTLKCIKSLKSQDYEQIKIVVVDDGSDDGTEKEIKKRYKDVEVLIGDGNLWCMGAFSMGVDWVKPKLQIGDYILTVNQDTYFDTDFVSKLVTTSATNSNAIVGSVNISDKTGKTLYHNHILKGGVFRPNLLSYPIPEVIENCVTLNTRGTLFPGSVFNKIGNFSKLFPQYAGDYEITTRAKNNGYQLVVCTSANCYSWDDNKNLAQKIKEKKRKTFKDIVDLLTSRRSPMNIYYSNLFILTTVPFPHKILGLLRVNLYIIKFIIVDYFFKSVLLGWRN